MSPFGTLLTAMVTPFKKDGSLDVAGAVSVAKHLVKTGHDGIVLNGTTGESPTTHSPEKAELIAAVVEAVGPQAIVVAGAGSNDTKHSVRMAEQAQEAGAHGLLVVSPYYSRPTQAGIVQHITTIADATDLSVMLYDIPGRTGVKIATETYVELAKHEKIVAVKDATGDVYTAARNLRATNLAWYAGDDSLYLPFLAHGAVGLVSVVGHVAGKELALIGQQFKDGQVAQAFDDFKKLIPLIDVIMGAGFGAIMIKGALYSLGLLKDNYLRSPLVPASQEQIDQIKDVLRELNIKFHD